jgi:hypothetical protein
MEIPYHLAPYIAGKRVTPTPIKGKRTASPLFLIFFWGNYIIYLKRHAWTEE